MKIGLFGGAYDPVTLCHIGVAKFLLNQNIVDEVWMHPCYISGYGKQMSDSRHRWDMLEIAVAEINDERIKGCYLELKFQNSGGILNFLDILHRQNRDNLEFYFITGLDGAEKIHTWMNWETVITSIPFIIPIRKGYNVNPNPEIWYKKNIHQLVDVDVIEGSSTDVRKDSRNNIKSPLISDNVWEYIQKHNLFRLPIS